jgi:cell division protease FtsH
VTQQRQVSPETAQAIDQSVRVIIDRNYERAKRLLVDNMDKLHAMADALLRYETIDHGQIDDIMSGRPAREPDGEADRSASKPGAGGAPSGGKPRQEPPVVGGAVGGV